MRSRLIHDIPAQQAERKRQLEDLMALSHNIGHSLQGNTQESDLEWLAGLLFENSRLGAGDVRTIPWLLSKDDWATVGLTPEGLMGSPHRFDALSDSEQEAWRKLARMVFYVIPAFTDRVAARFIRQSQVFRAEWLSERQRQEKAR